jgi:hypothetical protein
MPKQRDAVSSYGFWLEIVEPEVSRFIAEWPGSGVIHRSYLKTMVRCAVKPGAFLSNDLLKLKLGQWYSQEPDFVLALLTFLRKLFANQDKRFRIQRFLTERAIAKDCYGKNQNTWNLIADEIAVHIGKTVSGADVRKAEKILRDRLKKKPVEFFPMRDAPEVRTPKRPIKGR